MAKSNADRQRMYRQKLKLQRNAPVTPILDMKALREDFMFEGIQYIFLGDFGYGPVYAQVVGQALQERFSE